VKKIGEYADFVIENCRRLFKEFRQQANSKWRLTKKPK